MESASPFPNQLLFSAKLHKQQLDLFGSNHLTVTTSCGKRSTDFINLLAEIIRIYGPQTGKLNLPMVLVLDNAPVHTSELARAALVDRSHCLTVEWLPKYAPELNDIEPAWKGLKQTELAHQTFLDDGTLDKAIIKSLQNWNKERSHHS